MNTSPYKYPDEEEIYENLINYVYNPSNFLVPEYGKDGFDESVKIIALKYAKEISKLCHNEFDKTDLRYSK